MSNKDNEFVPVIGVDYSLNCPCFCFHKSIDDYYYIVFISAHLVGSDNTKTKKLIDQLNQLPNVEIYITPIIDESSETSETKSILENTRFAFSNFKEHMNGISDVVFEGFSFMSSSSKLYQFAGSNYYMRGHFIDNDLNVHVVSPKTVKKLAGNGSADKEEMLRFFLEKSKDSELKTLIQNYLDNSKAKAITKPLDDIVDSYWISNSFELITKKQTKVKKTAKKKKEK